MKDERQSSHLQQMMQRHKAHPKYELALPPFRMKKKSLKKMQKGDIVLLGAAQLDFVLLKAYAICARARVLSQGESMKLSITSVSEEPVKLYNSKKYETIICSFGKLQSRVLNLGHKIEIPAFAGESVTLISEKKVFGTAKLVKVEEEIALEITEVNDG